MGEATNKKNSDFFEQSRYQLTLQLNILLGIILAILGISFYFLDQDVIYLNSIGLLSCISLTILQITTKNYKLPAILMSIIGNTLSILTLLLLKDSFHFVDPLWMIIIALFTYFTLGKLAGNISILIQFSAIALYIIFYSNHNLSLIKELSQGELFSLALNSFLCAIVIGYLIHQFLKRNSTAAEQYQTLNKELEFKNELVENQNREKTAMLKEIHHRVKNNLQVITSLLRLQSRDIENQEAVTHFNEAIDRISAMALIHNQMYQSKDLNKIELEPYLQSLSKNILNSYILNIPVNITFKIELKYVTSNVIVSIALIFNELISNSLKHAFSNKSEGTIAINILEDSAGTIKFLFIDDGDWKTPEKSDSFGLELIDTLTQQLNGTFTRTSENGTTYEFILTSERELV
jgi:two-component sensor histidine kinase